jgi:HEAT repeat protein
MKKRLPILISIFALGLLLCTIVRAEKDNPRKATDDRYSKLLVTSKVVEALGKIGDPEVRDILIEALGSKEFFIRANAAQALGRIQDKKSIPLLRDLLDDKNYLVKILAAVALFDLGQQDTAGVLFALLKDDNPEVRSATAAEVGRLGEEFLFALTEIVQKEEEYSVRVKALEQLGENKFEYALADIRRALDDKNAYVRRAACFAIGEIEDKQSIPLILGKLDDEDIRVRAEAKLVLGKFGDRSKIDVFRKDMDEQDPLLVASSYVALARLGEVNILPALLEAIKAPDSTTIVRTQAAYALDILKPDVEKYVEEVLEEAGVLHNLPLVDSLQFDYQVDGRNLVSMFIQALSDIDGPLYQDAPLVLQVLGDEMALPALRQALSQDNPDLVATTAYVLGEFEDKEAVDYLIETFKKYGI